MRWVPSSGCIAQLSAGFVFGGEFGAVVGHDGEAMIHRRQEVRQDFDSRPVWVRLGPRNDTLRNARRFGEFALAHVGRSPRDS